MESSMALTNARRPNARRSTRAASMPSAYHQKTENDELTLTEQDMAVANSEMS